MSISYSTEKKIDNDQLERLFLSVLWESGRYPANISKACEKSDAVFTAWDDTILVGLCSALSDGTFCAYIPWLLVIPEYQKQGIGKQLLLMCSDHFSNIPSIILNAHSGQEAFYRHCGFITQTNAIPMIKKQLF